MMFKRKLFVLGVFALAVVTIVGSGFSAWTFTTESREDLSTGVAITESYAFGSIKHKSNAWRIVLDQGTNKTSLMDGITLQKGSTTRVPDLNTNSVVDDDFFPEITEDTETIEAYWYVSIGQFDSMYPGAITKGTGTTLTVDTSKFSSLKFYLNLYIDNKLATYIKPTINSGFGNVSANAGDGAHKHENTTSYRVTFSYKGGATANDNCTYDVAIGTDPVTVETASSNVTLAANTYYKFTMTYKVNPTALFQYQSNKKPQTFAEYRDMVANMNAYPSTVKTAATIENNTVTFADGKITAANNVMAGLKYYIPNAADPIIFEFQVTRT